MSSRIRVEPVVLVSDDVPGTIRRTSAKDEEEKEAAGQEQ